VIIGNGGAEYGVRGYVSAYDTETGKLVWRFYTVPGKPGVPDGAVSDSILAKLAVRTWSPDSWELTKGGGGGTAWDSMAYDPELDLLYVGVGNSGYWPLKYRSPAAPRGGNNDNLFISSILALRPETGEYVWHYQTTPGDQWDYTATQHMILADLDIGGKLRKVLLQAPKNGFFYVLDRQTGKLISARPYGKVNWASSIDLYTGRPVVNPDSDYSNTGRPWKAYPGTEGVHDWHPMSFSPRTGLVYIPTWERSFTYVLDTDFQALPKGYDIGVDFSASTLPITTQAIADSRASVKGYLTAWDPVAQKSVWRVPNTTHANGGVLATAGNLLFQGGADGAFFGYDAATGRKIWAFDAQSGIFAAPVTWAKNGRQYVTVLAGWGTNEAMGAGSLGWSDEGPRRNISRVVTFALNGTAHLPAAAGQTRRQLQPPAQFADAGTIELGRRLYHRTCFGCHGFAGLSAGVIPDLRYSGALGDKAAWQAIVLDGALTGSGMVSFKDTYSPRQLDAIRAYIINQAHASMQAGVR
jgi:quinohemoprotein ethanol dehydrogenase